LELLSALVLGFLGSLHCAGMCGPIALALPLNSRSWASRITGGLLCNSGRTITYILLGTIFGLAGMGLALGGLQQWTSIAAGVIMILSVVVPRIGKLSDGFSRLTSPLTNGLKKAFGKLFSQRTYGSLFMIGLLNGFLPCGLVYIALAGALVMSLALQGALYMLIFGIGTFPMMLAISLAGNLATQKLRQRMRLAIPYFIVLLGLLFILRGMNLGIPYLSPKLAEQSGKPAMECCKPKN
jgi:uncharacterized protein